MSTSSFSRLLRWGVSVVIAAVGALLVFGPGFAQEGAAEPTAATLERGIALYQQLGCGACHALTVANTAGFFGPSHDAAADLAEERLASPDYRGDATDIAGYLRESIVDPTAYLVPAYALGYHRMPGYDTLEPADLDALVALLAAQRGETSPSPDRTE